MTFHKYLDPHYGIPHGQTSRIESMLQSERDALKGYEAGSFDAKAARTNIEALTEALERSRNGDAIRAQREKDLQAERDRKHAEYQAAEEAKLKDQLRIQFKAGNPTSTDADFERLYPTLKDQHLIRQADTVMEETRRRYRGLI